MFDIKENLKNLPDKPGVYLHKDKEGNVIYVGKAVSLKRRVRQYFQSSSNMDRKVRAMVSHIKEFEYIITETEMEALLLEERLIKKYMPKYNVLLRDDKTFPYIKLTLNEEWPRLIKTRRYKDDGSMYFGPYTDASAVNEIIDLLSRIYKLKRCSAQSFAEDWRPCLNYHINECRGICSGEVDKASYMNAINQVIDFLNGNTKELLKYLEGRMQEEANNMNFEQAAEYRDLIASVKAIPDQERLDMFISKVKRNKVRVVRRRAEEIKQRELEKNQSLQAAWEWVGLNNVNRIEAYDVSHIAGTDSVGAMVVYEKYKAIRKDYRRFRIKDSKGDSDIDSLKEIVERRMKRAIEGSPGFNVLPDLLLIDGGENQVNAIKQLLAELQIDIAVAGMVKDDKHRTRGIIVKGREFSLSENRILLQYIAMVQNEVHRFAIDYHRGLRSKKLKASVLDEIPGIGEKRKIALLSVLGSIDAIANADIEVLQNIPGMNRTIAERVKEYLKNKKN
ncbi:MAG: excinuclease ABC subunit C [Clostridiales bacterium]|nr:excinuclease ABC subunit C [Clostridiales bacterium]